MPNSKDERSPSADGSPSPRRHRWRSRSRSKSPVKRKSKSPTSARPKSPTSARPNSKSPARSDVEEGRVRSRSRSPPRARRSRSRTPEAGNPGNNLYVTGLSTRVTSEDLQKHFSKEGKVLECQLVVDPRTKESRGFAFVTLETTADADRCVKYLNRSVLEGRLITVEKAKRSRGRTPTPGRYQGLKEKPSAGRGRDRRSRSPPRHHGGRDSYSRDRRNSPRRPEKYDSYRRPREYSPRR